MLKRSFVVSSLILVATVFATVAHAASLLEQGIEAFNKGHYEDAVSLFAAAKGSESDNPLLHYYMANTLVRLNYKTDAIREYKLAMDLQPKGKLADYCLWALRSLGAAPPAPIAAAPPPSTNMLVTKKDIPNIQQPQVVSIVDDLAQSYRVDMIMSNLQSLYGDVIVFRRSAISAPDQKTKDILKRYNIRQTPAIILVGDDGTPIQQFAGNDIVEGNLRKQVEDLAKMSHWKEPGASQDPHLVEFRHEVLTELEARIAADQLRVDHEIKEIQNLADQQVIDLTPSRSRYALNNADAIAQTKQEADAKIQVIREDFEKRKSEWQAAAEAKIQARKH